MSPEEMQKHIEALELLIENKEKAHKIACAELEAEIVELICERDDLLTEEQELKAEIELLKKDEEKYWDGYHDCLLDYCIPDWFMDYQKQMVRDAVEHIRARDTLRGLSQ